MRKEELKRRAVRLIREFKGSSYVHGIGCLERTGTHTLPLGKRVLLITSLHLRDTESFEKITRSLTSIGAEISSHTLSARPNALREDVIRMREFITASIPNVVMVASGGSGIDAAKAAVILAGLEGDLEDYFGVDKVSQKMTARQTNLLPLFAVQTASSSAAHLTKYANITDEKTFQKKLIVDDAIVPPRSLFDYGLTQSMSDSFTCDGAFDGLSHCLEVYYGVQAEEFPKIEEIALTGIELIITSLEKAVDNPRDLEARESLGLATDLGGYAIMTGGTNGAHLNSFSLVDILSHGRACAILNPYYTVFFSSVIQRQLKTLAELFSACGLISQDAGSLEGKELALAVAGGLKGFSQRVGFPTTLLQIQGFTPEHLKKTLHAAKNPQLEMKLRNMPLPLTAEGVEEYMGSVLDAAVDGDFNRIRIPSEKTTKEDRD
jgi:alcohol dehydrogenase